MNIIRISTNSIICFKKCIIKFTEVCGDNNKSLAAVIYFLKGIENKEIWLKLSFKKN